MPSCTFNAHVVLHKDEHRNNTGWIESLLWNSFVQLYRLEHRNNTGWMESLLWNSFVQLYRLLWWLQQSRGFLYHPLAWCFSANSEKSSPVPTEEDIQVDEGTQCQKVEPINQSNGKVITLSAAWLLIIKLTKNNGCDIWLNIYNINMFHVHLLKM